MSDIPNKVRSTARRDLVIAEILKAAWQLALLKGLNGFTVRDLGSTVGLKASSLYSYFPSKHAIFDAMFEQGNRQLYDVLVAERDRAQGLSREESFQSGLLTFFDFCVADVARFQLLFQRTIPGFEPSAQAYSVATAAYGVMAQQLRSLGFSERDDDLVTAYVVGLVSQQLANDPEGTRWRDLVPRTAEILAALSPEGNPA